MKKVTLFVCDGAGPPGKCSFVWLAVNVLRLASLRGTSGAQRRSEGTLNKPRAIQGPLWVMRST